MTEWAYCPFFICQEKELILEELEALIEPVVKGLGCELWGIDYVNRGRYSALKVFIDSESGVGIDDCERVSRQLGSLFDAEDPISGKYVLEVSSPGLDRRLFKLSQYEKSIGAQVKISLRFPFEGKRRLSGRLCGVQANDVVLRTADAEFLLPFTGIERANIVPEYS